MSTAISIEVQNPFPGLRPFLESEEHLFFGRESQVDKMIDKLARTRFLAVVGTSGSGKSSLVNCGLKPALLRGLVAKAGTAWRMAQLRPGNDPIRATACGLARQGVLFTDFVPKGLSLEDMIQATLRMSRLGIVDIYEQALSGGKANLLIVVDQFEELFRYGKGQASAASGGTGINQTSAAFVNLLLEAASTPDYPIYVVLTMRSDFLGDCAQFSGLPEAINEAQFLVPRMTREERRAATAGPVAVGRAEISPVLLTQLVNDVGDNPDQLSILQHALNRTWSYWQSHGQKGPLSLAHYEAIGTMANALDQHAEEAFAELSDGRQQIICQKIFQALTDKGTDVRGIRRPTNVATLSAVSEATPAELSQIIEVFRKPGRSFLMPPVPEPLEPATVVDISHESLMRVWCRLKSWVEEEAESAAQYGRLVQNAALRAKGGAGLMTEPELSLTLQWRDKWQPNAAWAARYHPGFEQAMTFLEESRQARDAEMHAEEQRRRRELRRARMVAAILFVAFWVAAGFGVFGLIERSKAKDAQAALNAALRRTEDARANEENFTNIAAERSLKSAIKEVTEAEQVLKKDMQAAKSEIVISKDKSNLAAAQEALQSARVQKARAAAVHANGSIIDPGSLSVTDLFDVSAGAKVTAVESGTRNRDDMFGGNEVSPDTPEVATLFPDGKRGSATHFIQWRTIKPVTVAGVALFAAHDARHQHAFEKFTMFAKNQKGAWTQVAEFHPALPYGQDVSVSCGTGPCRWPQNVTPGTALAVCLQLAPALSAQEFKAEFVQAVNGSGPRIVQLDGHSDANCSK